MISWFPNERGLREEQMASKKRKSSSGARAKAKARRAAVFLWISVFALWLAWSGHFSFSHPFLFFMGLTSATLVTWLCWRMGLVDGEMTPLHLALPTLRYLPWLAWQVLVSCRDVLVGGAGDLSKLDPEVLTVKADQKTSVGFASYANSITLTPGTLSVNLKSAEREILVHAFSKVTADSLRTGEMNRRVTEIEGG